MLTFSKATVIAVQVIGWLAVIMILHRIEDATMADGMIKEAACMAANSISGIGCMLSTLYIIDCKYEPK